MRREDRPRETGHGVAVVGERDPAGVPGDEGAGDRRLEPPDVLRDRRLADAEALTGEREAAGLGDREERAEQDRVEHGGPPVGTRSSDRPFDFAMD
ncbi:hypothetical protein Cus16_0735 [Curtobacterium sp. ER1/6]|nr:hypothetical protein Cus16_0735 [Curtobacterium sp. ER1/6]